MGGDLRVLFSDENRYGKLLRVLYSKFGFEVADESPRKREVLEEVTPKFADLQQSG